MLAVTLVLFFFYLPKAASVRSKLLLALPFVLAVFCWMVVQKTAAGHATVGTSLYGINFHKGIVSISSLSMPLTSVTWIAMMWI